MIRSRRSLVGATTAAALVAAGAVWWLSADNDLAGKPDLDNPMVIARGEAVYAAHCASCHGANLEGQPNWRQRLPSGRLPAPPHDATGHTWHHSDAELFAMVKDGLAELVPGYETDMPAYKDVLSDADIWAVLAFIKSTWPEDIRARQQRMNR
jgi:mono/diheme cytochrome c family protein